MAEQRKVGQLPGFIFDVAAWRGSRSVQRMSFAERGVYFEMLLEQWEKRNMPDDANAVADRVASNADQVAEVIAAWPVVRVKFVRCTGDDKRIYNVPLERTRRAQRENLRNKQEAGRIAGKASAAKRAQKHDLGVDDRSTTVQRSSTEKVSRGEGSTGKVSGEEITARSKRPIFTGQRLTVFEWQLDNCMKMLGPLTDDFDLHSWFGDLDQHAAQTNLVIPRRDGGEWLEARLLEECRRRGLPIAQPQQAGKLSTRLASAMANIAREGA